MGVPINRHDEVFPGYGTGKNNDREFAKTIDEQIKAIGQTGATHVAIATPYDDEFLPFLTLWVNTARKYGLNIWFRGNWSGWEQWFGYGKINREEHLIKTAEFINKNAGLFRDGDVFTACPECENGGPGDPRFNNDANGHRLFLIKEYELTKGLFNKLNKKVKSNYLSMNGDVARLIMDEETTSKLDGLVVIDHYVSSPEILANDIKNIAVKSKAKIVLGEFGTPIPDIHGKMTDEEQSKWIKEALEKLSAIPEVIGLNYWVSYGGSTEIWRPDNSEKAAVSVLSSFFKPQVLNGKIVNELDWPVENAMVETRGRKETTDAQGMFSLPFIGENSQVEISHKDYEKIQLTVSEFKNNQSAVLIKTSESFVYKLLKKIKELID